jgi:catalase
MAPLVIAPAGGKIGSGDDPVTVQRTFATARSIEFDAILVAGVPGMGADAFPGRDAKAGDTGPAPTDPRLLLLLSEAFRHGKAIGLWAGADAVLPGAGIPADAPGVVHADTGATAFEQVGQLLAAHRVWERFPTEV